MFAYNTTRYGYNSSHNLLASILQLCKEVYNSLVQYALGCFHLIEYRYGL